MNRSKNLLDQLKRKLLNKYFIAACISALTMNLTCWLGNPHIGNFYFHFIPEMTASYLIGFWLHSQHYSFKYPLIIYILATLLTPNILGVGSDPFRYIIPALLGSSILLGHVTAKKLAMNTASHFLRN